MTQTTRQYIVLGLMGLALAAAGFADAVPAEFKHLLTDLSMVSTGLAGLFSKPPEVA